MNGKKILGLLKKVESFEALAQLWSYASKMRTWLSTKRQNLLDRLSKTSPEMSSDDTITEANAKIETITAEISKKSSLMLCLDVPQIDA